MNLTNLYNTRFKKLALGIYIIIILAIIFAIAFNKRDTFLFFAKVPDYSTDKGYKIVSISDYDKYKQGYCLKENKILPKEEIIKRGIVDYTKKAIEIGYLYVDGYCEVFGNNNDRCAYGKKQFIDYIGYNYSKELDTPNWYEKLKAEYDKLPQKRTRHDLRDIFFTTFHAKPINLTTDDIFIDDNKAGFKKNLIYYDGVGSYSIYNGTIFAVSLQNQSFGIYNYFSIYESINNHTFTYFKQSYDRDSTIILDKDEFDKIANYRSVDNCGYTNFNVKETFDKHKDNIGKGG